MTGNDFQQQGDPPPSRLTGDVPSTGLRFVVEYAQSYFPTVRITGGASVREVDEFENDLKVTLPDDYPGFLTTYGALGFHGLETYRIVSGKSRFPGPPNAFAVTLEEQRSGALPSGTIIIASTGHGPVYLLKAADDLTTTSGIYLWDYSASIDDRQREFSTFAEFASKMICEYVEDYIAEKRAENDLGQV